MNYFRGIANCFKADAAAMRDHARVSVQADFKHFDRVNWKTELQVVAEPGRRVQRIAQPTFRLGPRLQNRAPGNMPRHLGTCS